MNTTGFPISTEYDCLVEMILFGGEDKEFKFVTHQGAVLAKSVYNSKKGYHRLSFYDDECMTESGKTIVTATWAQELEDIKHLPYVNCGKCLDINRLAPDHFFIQGLTLDEFTKIIYIGFNY